MDLSQEELKKINELQNTARFQHSWKCSCTVKKQATENNR